jgi:hypothetical protein
MVYPHAMLRLEYLYYSFDSNVAVSGPISPGSFLPVTFIWASYNVQVVRAGLQVLTLESRVDARLEPTRARCADRAQDETRFPLLAPGRHGLKSPPSRLQALVRRDSILPTPAKPRAPRA